MPRRFHHKAGHRPSSAGATEGPRQANHRRNSKIDVAQVPSIAYGEWQKEGSAEPGIRQLHFSGSHSSIIPRFNPIVTAWVRSLALSLARMFETCRLTVSSPM